MLMGIESACIPLPSEVIMPFAGYLVHMGKLNLLGVATAGALGCNLAWGLVDAIMYLMNSMTERARGRVALNAVRSAADAATAHRHIADALPPLVASVLEESDLETMRQRLVQMPEPPAEQAVEEPHRHLHGPGCGHLAIEHGDHVDYIHDGHRHAVHGGHYDEH